MKTIVVRLAVILVCASLYASWRHETSSILGLKPKQQQQRQQQHTANTNTTTTTQKDGPNSPNTTAHSNPHNNNSDVSPIQEEGEISNNNITTHTTGPPSSAPSCVSPACIDKVARELVKQIAPKQKKDPSVWCHHNPNLPYDKSLSLKDNLVRVLQRSKTLKNRQSHTEGLFLQGATKTSSSSTGGVMLRIAIHNNCTSILFSYMFSGATFAKRDRNKSFLGTTIRDPGDRAISRIFFTTLPLYYRDVLGEEPEKRMTPNETDAWIITRLQNASPGYRSTTSFGQGGHQTNLLANTTLKQWLFWKKEEPEQVQNEDRLLGVVKGILERTDTFVVVDRMDESLVVWALLLGIPVSDVLSSSSKVSGNFYYRRGVCVKLSKSHKTPAVQAFLDSNTWRAMNYGDLLLHRAAQVLLDRTIQNVIGQDVFEKALAEFRRLKELDNLHCAPYLKFACSKDGQDQHEASKKTCYHMDYGCGYACLDALAKNYSMGLYGSSPSSSSHTQ